MNTMDSSLNTRTLTQHKPIYLLFGGQKLMPSISYLILFLLSGPQPPLKNKLIQQMIRRINVIHESGCASSF